MTASTPAKGRRWVWPVAVISVVLIGALVAALIAYEQIQTTYPGGIQQWANDVGGPAQLSQGDIAKRVRSALLATTAAKWHSDTAYVGTAFAFDGRTEVITAAHLLPKPLINLVVVDAGGANHSADLLSRDDQTDAAVLRADSGATPLSAAVHPLYKGSRVYLGGNPTGAAGGRVLNGLVSSTDYDGTADGSPVTHAILVSGVVFEAGMAGGPAVDLWGRVIGIVRAGGPDGIVLVPLAGFAAVAKKATADGIHMYIGPPLVTATGDSLILSASSFGTLGAQRSGSKVTFNDGPLDGDFVDGALWVRVDPTIGTAVASVGDSACLANVTQGWMNLTTTQAAIGDGGRLIVGSLYGALIYMQCWSERNVEVIWWLTERGYDESTFFANIAKQQEQVLYNAT